VAFVAEPGIEGAAGACFGWLLVALAVFDFQHLWLPNRLTFLLAATGLIAGFIGGAPEIGDRLIGGVLAYLLLTMTARAYFRFRGRQGLGAGDAKLFGAIGLWLGWQTLPFVLLGAALMGVYYILREMADGRSITADTRLPLGTLMAVAAFPIWILSR
jgi:leader peptidase (prepilin peptidase)/N-methyltransferase